MVTMQNGDGGKREWLQLSLRENSQKVKDLFPVMAMSPSSNFKASQPAIAQIYCLAQGFLYIYSVFEDNEDFFQDFYVPFKDDIICSLLEKPYWGRKSHKF